MAMTTWLAAQGLLASPRDFWSSLRLPDAFAVDLAAGTVARLAPA